MFVACEQRTNLAKGRKSHNNIFLSYLTYKSAWYRFPFSTPSKVGIWLFLKLSVESYTAVTTEETQIESGKTIP